MSTNRVNPLFSSGLDLNAYFKRIGYEGIRSPTLETLRSLHALHPQAIAFENLTPFLRQSVQLDSHSLNKKLIEGGRGGYCFEQNLLFWQILETLGFCVKGLAARVRWNVPEQVMTPRSHMLLLLDLQSIHYIADVGFGGWTLTAPLRLETNTEQPTPHELFRITEAPDGYRLEVNLKGEWKAIYIFDLQKQYLQDYEVSNWYLSNNPHSRFVTDLIVARPASDRRYALFNNQLSIHFPNAETRKQELTTPAELRSTLENTFHLTLPDTPDLDNRLKELVEQKPTQVTR